MTLGRIRSRANPQWEVWAGLQVVRTLGGVTLGRIRSRANPQWEVWAGLQVGRRVE